MNSHLENRKWARNQLLDTPERLDFQNWQESEYKVPNLLPEVEFELYFGKTLEILDGEEVDNDKDSLTVDLFDEAKYRVYFGYFRLNLVDTSKIAKFEQTNRPSVGRIPLQSHYNPHSSIHYPNKYKSKLSSNKAQKQSDDLVEYYPWSQNFSLEMLRRGLRPNESYNKLLVQDLDGSRQDTSQIMSFTNTDLKASGRLSTKEFHEKPHVCTLYGQPNLSTRGHAGHRTGSSRNRQEGSGDHNREHSGRGSNVPLSYGDHEGRINYGEKQGIRTTQFTGILSSAEKLKVR